MTTTMTHKTSIRLAALSAVIAMLTALVAVRLTLAGTAVVTDWIWL